MAFTSASVRWMPSLSALALRSAQVASPRTSSGVPSTPPAPAVTRDSTRPAACRRPPPAAAAGRDVRQQVAGRMQLAVAAHHVLAQEHLMRRVGGVRLALVDE